MKVPQHFTVLTITLCMCVCSSYFSQLEFSDDIVRIIQTAINSDGGHPESRKANSMVKSFFIRVSWFKLVLNDISVLVEAIVIVGQLRVKYLGQGNNKQGPLCSAKASLTSVLHQMQVYANI